MDFDPTTFHDNAPPGISAAELAKLNAGVVEGITKAEASYQRPVSGIPLSDMKVADLEKQFRGVELRQAFTKQPDSAGVPASFDTGQTATTVAVGTAAQQYVSGGRLRSTPTGGSSAAGYYTANLTATAKRIGGKFTFIPHSTLGCVATLAITETQYVSSLPRIGLHLAISPTTWILGYAPNTTGTVTIVASNTFAEPLLVDGVTEYTAEAVIVGRHRERERRRRKARRTATP